MALAKVAGITDYAFFYPTVSFLAGTAVGLWFDSLLKRRGAAKEDALVSLGYDLRNFSKLINERAERSLELWPRFIMDLVPDLRALVIRVERAGLPGVPPEVMKLSDDGRHLAGYLQYVGTFLVNNQFDEARKATLDHRDRKACSASKR